MTEESQTKSESLYKGLYDHMTSGSAIYEVINDGSKDLITLLRILTEKALRSRGKPWKGFSEKAFWI